MLKHKLIESHLPVFTGFYSTVFEPSEDQVIEAPYKYDDYTFDYDGYRTKTSKACVNAIESKLKEFGLNIKITYQSLYSPREYNFANDSINVKYKVEDPKAINKYILANFEAFSVYIKEHYTSRSGFMSFWSNDAETWLNEYMTNKKDLSHCFGAILEFIFKNEGYSDNDLYEDANYMGAIFLDGWLNEGVGGVRETIETYANENYTTKQPETIVIELTQLFDDKGIYFDWLTYKYISEIVNGIFKTIDKNTLDLFAKVK